MKEVLTERYEERCEQSRFNPFNMAHGMDFDEQDIDDIFGDLFS